MKCRLCNEEIFNTEFPIGVELLPSIETIHSCNGKKFRVVGLRSKRWFVIEEIKNEMPGL
jgi:hypothetical protein